MSKLAGKVAVITGGSSGIGLETAKEFVAHGARVVIFGRSAKALDDAVTQLGANAYAVQGDVSNLVDIDKLFAQTKTRFGGVDVLFVNAAIVKLAPIDATSEELYDEMMNINLKGAYFTLQKAIPHLNKGASVIVATSYLNDIGFANSSLISAGKAALRSLVRVAAAELADRGIRVNAIMPGAISTPLWGKIGLPDDVLASAGAAIAGKVPSKRFGQPQDVAKAVLFLASDDSSYVVGSEMAVDGGMNQV